MQYKKAQVSIEYLVIMGFVVFVLIGILGASFLYTGTIKDKIKMDQVIYFSNKVISTAETVFYSGSPSKSTIFGYLPEGVKEIEIKENSLILTVQTNHGIAKMAFSSNVPISGNITQFQGLRKIKIEAKENQVEIS